MPRRDSDALEAQLHEYGGLKNHRTSSAERESAPAAYREAAGGLDYGVRGSVIEKNNALFLAISNKNNALFR